MIIGIGTDIIEIARIARLLAIYPEKFLDKILTKDEKNTLLRLKNYTATLAGRFAAKEAIVKAFGTGFGKELSFQDMEIINNSFGKPIVYFSSSVNKLFNSPNILISISHSKAYATAIALWQD